MDVSKSSSRSIRLERYREQLERVEKRKAVKEKKQKKRNRPSEDIEIVSASATIVTDDVNQAHTEGEVNQRKKRKESEREHKLWKHFDRNNDDANVFFADYYKKQLGMENEWNEFSSSLQKPLPVTFRLNRSRFPFLSHSLKKRLETQFRFSGSFVRVGMDKIVASNDVVKETPWARDIYLMGVDRIGFKKAKALGPLYEAIRRESAVGHLARQGVASMLPVLVLSPKADDTVLDMCAAPGSKSEQLLQYVTGNGMVVTNDSDPKRLQTVLRRFRHVGSANHVVSCSRGEDLYHSLGSEVFDGVICDVPCSGDGTIRKYPHLWRTWRASKALLLHPIQLQLAQSSASLLKVGGRMIYSTCSINPIEDEAVVASLLESAGGALKLVPIKLPGFKLRPGIDTWDASDKLQLAGTVEEGASKKRNYKDIPTVTKSMKPPAEAKSLHLEHCARVMSHDNDSEGFFVALIEKVRPWEMEGTRTMSAKEAKEVLRKSGFNPTQLANRQLSTVSWTDWSGVVKNAVEKQFQMGSKATKSIALRYGEDNRATLVLQSRKVMEFLKIASLVSILHAGVHLASAFAVKNADSGEIEGLSEFIPVAQGSKYLLDCTQNIAKYTERIDEFMKLLSLLISKQKGDEKHKIFEEENEEDDNVSVSSSGSDDDKNDKEYDDVIFCDELPGWVSEELEDLPVGRSIPLAFDTKWAPKSENAGAAASAKGPRLSAAERRRLKKNPNYKKQETSVQVITDKFDMFHNMSLIPETMVIWLHKNTPSTIKVASDTDYIVSCYEALKYEKLNIN